MLDPSSVKKFVGDLEAIADVDIEAPDRTKPLEVVSQYDALWIHVEQRIDKEVFEQASHLKVINTASTGTDHIDVEEAERRGIRVLSITKDYGLLDQFTATAECAWMLLMASCRHLRAASGHVLEGESVEFRRAKNILNSLSFRARSERELRTEAARFGARARYSRVRSGNGQIFTASQPRQQRLFDCSLSRAVIAGPFRQVRAAH